MARKVNCKLCGREVVATGSRTTYCPTCADTVARERYKQYILKKKIEAAREEKEPFVPIHTCDSPERVALCLSCTRKKCPGSCDDLMAIRKKERGAR